MNRQQKIIVSITGIVIVILALFGLTYAYFVTQIQGNENDKSIEVTTANLKLVYRDGSPTILSKSNIVPGETIGSKTFTVTNEGNSTVENYAVYLESVTNTFEFKEDVTYVLTCSSSVENKECNGTIETMYPSSNKILVSNSIVVGEVQTYEIFIYYKESGEDQSKDMNKEISGKLNIKDPKTINPYATISGTIESPNDTLAYKIINSAKQGLNDTIYVNTPPTKVAEQTSGNNEKVLSIANDDYGVSYYFRGNVTNNYMDFAGMCWRIVRIEGDGSIKLVLEDQDQTCATSNGNWNINDVENTPTAAFGALYHNGISYNENGYIRTPNYNTFTDRNLAIVEAFNAFETNKLSSNLEDLKEELWCLNTSTYSDQNGTTLLSNTDITNYITNGTSFYYETNVRFSKNKPSLNCSSSSLIKNNYVATLTADEAVYTGLNDKNSSLNTYLSNEFQRTNNLSFWTLSPSYFAKETEGKAYYVNSTMMLNHGDSEACFSIRPSITLKSGTGIGEGNGTKTNAYQIVQEF